MNLTIDDYIQNSPEAVRPILELVRKIALQIDPDLTQTISWSMPTFRKNGKNILHYAAHKAHLGIYPGPGTIVHFQERLKEYKTSKGAIQFPFSRPLDRQLLEDLIRFNLKD